MAWGFIQSNPVQAVQPPKPERPQLHVPTAEQLVALIDAAKGTVWEMPMLLSAWTGARRSEVLGLAWEGIDLERGTMRITRTLQKAERGRPAEFLAPKTHRSRRAIALNPALVQRLRSYRQEQLQRRMKAQEWIDLDLVCDRGDGGAHDPDEFTKAFRRIAAKAGLHPDTRLHDVRHAVATALLEGGVDTAIRGDPRSQQPCFHGPRQSAHQHRDHRAGCYRARGSLRDVMGRNLLGGRPSGRPSSRR